MARPLHACPEAAFAPHGPCPGAALDPAWTVALAAGAVLVLAFVLVIAWLAARRLRGAP